MTLLKIPRKCCQDHVIKSLKVCSDHSSYNCIIISKKQRTHKDFLGIFPKLGLPPLFSNYDKHANPGKTIITLSCMSVSFNSIRAPIRVSKYLILVTISTYIVLGKIANSLGFFTVGF